MNKYQMKYLINDPLVDFRINTYFSAIDLILSELDRRFLGDGDENYEQIGLFKDFSLLSIKRMQEIKSNPAQLPKDAFFFFCLQNLWEIFKYRETL